MSSKTTKSKANHEAYHLLPPDSDIRIISVRLTEELLEALRSDRSGKALLILDADRDGSVSGEEIRVGDKSWKFEYKPETEVDCISKDPRSVGIYNTIGTIKHKLTVKGELTGKVKDKIKKKSEESVQQKRARSQTAIQDDIHQPKGKRKLPDSAGTFTIDTPAAPKIRKPDPKPPTLVVPPRRAPPPESDAERKAIIERQREELIHALAARDLRREEVAQVVTGDVRREVMDEVADWHTSLLVYRLKPVCYQRVYAELWPHYTDEQRAAARRVSWSVRVGQLAAASETISTPERAAKAVDQFRIHREQMLRITEELDAMQVPTAPAAASLWVPPQRRLVMGLPNWVGPEGRVDPEERNRINVVLLCRKSARQLSSW